MFPSAPSSNILLLKQTGTDKNKDKRKDGMDVVELDRTYCECQSI